jgi:hypothetical protein
MKYNKFKFTKVENDSEKIGEKDLKETELNEIFLKDPPKYN